MVQPEFFQLVFYYHLAPDTYHIFDVELQLIIQQGLLWIVRKYKKIRGSLHEYSWSPVILFFMIG